MDFSQIPWLETALNYTIGGVSVFTIIVIATKIIKWLKNNNVQAALQNFIGSEVTIDLTAITEEKLKGLTKLMDAKLLEIQKILTTQSNVIVDMADIHLSSKLASDGQKERLKADTANIRTSEPAPPKKVISVKLEPVKVVKKDIQLD